MIRVEVVLLAESAEGADTHSVIRGMGPTLRAVPRYPALIRATLVIVVTTPWDDAGKPQQLTLTVFDSNNSAIIGPTDFIEGVAIAGPLAPPGADITSVVTSLVALPIQAPGTYRLVVGIRDGAPPAERVFHCIELTPELVDRLRASGVLR